MNPGALDRSVTETPTARWQREQRIRDVLDPHRNIRYQHLGWAVDLVLRHHWTVKPAAHIHDAIALCSSRTIETTPIAGDAELAVLLHEAGHLEDKGINDSTRRQDVDWMRGDVRLRPSLESELVAWRWAMATLGRLRWTKNMQAYMNECLRTYQATLVRDYKQVEIMEQVIQEGAELVSGIVRLKPQPLADISALRQMAEGIRPWR